MAVDWKVEHKRGSEYLFFPDEIVVKPEDNGRFEPGKINDLVYSFGRVGQLQPVSIQNEGGRPVLKAGFNRWQAAVEINNGKPLADRMRLRCVLNRGTALETTVMNIHENHFRNPVTELDDAHNIARLMDRYGKSIEEVAETYQQDVKWVKKRLKLLKLSDEAKHALMAGEVKITAAAKLAAMTPEQQHAAISRPVTEKATAPRPGRKAQIEALESVAGSPAYHKNVREFAEAFAKYVRGEIEIGEL